MRRRVLFVLMSATVGCAAIIDVSDPTIVPYPEVAEAGTDARATDGHVEPPMDGSHPNLDAGAIEAGIDSGGDPDAGDTCVIDSALVPAGTISPSNPCQSCQPSVSTTLWSNSADGTSCDTGTPPRICHAGVCTVGCEVGGTFRGPGTYDPSNPCQVCIPVQSTSSWTAVAEGGAGACAAGKVCHTGACASGCGVSGFQAPDAFNPNEPCQQCVPAKSVSSWSNVTDGTACGSGQTCAGGTCGTQCVIGGSTFVPGAHNPANPCQICQPGSSPSSWSTVSCSSGQVCDGATGNCVCNATSCPNGCCSGGSSGTCQAYASESGGLCGTAGAACSACGNGLCDKTSGTCACNANTCAGGCCNGGTGGGCLALASESPSACGKNGAACGTCMGGTPACVQGGCAACNPGTTQCSGAQVQTCSAAGAWSSPSNCPSGQTCSGTSCQLVCTKTITTTLNVVNPFGVNLLIGYNMVGGGGGQSSAYAGSGGGSSAILVNTSLQDVAAGGIGGNSPASDGQKATGNFSLGVGTTLHVYVGGGGGSASANAGGGGGSGYFGGGGGGQGTNNGSGGSAVGGAGGAGCSPAAGTGTSQHGGDGGCSSSDNGKGGNGGNGGAAGTGLGAGGGGGFGGGGGGGNTCCGTNTGVGGSNGANGGNASNNGGLGSNNWSSATSLPAAAGQGGVPGVNAGGNGGLVILTYTTPTGTCSL